MKKPFSEFFEIFSSPPALFILAALEFSLAAAFTLGASPDPKNAFLFGYSFSRLLLFLISCLPALFFLVCAGMSALGISVIEFIEKRVREQPLAWAFLVLVTGIFALIVVLLPVEMLGGGASYFERLRPVLFVALVLPVQFSLYRLKPQKGHPDYQFLRQGLFFLAILLGLAFFIASSGLGITPEQDHWNVAGTPLTALQLVGIILVAVLIFGVFGFIGKRLVSGWQYLDLLLVFVLFAVALLLWVRTPQHQTEFISQPSSPYFQAYPASDAQAHDVGAISILQGFGIYFRDYTDKPLYMIFLAFLHLLGGFDYNLLAVLHAGFMAFMAPVLYIFGRAFHSRFFGFLLAGVIVLRQQNAIILTKTLNFGATPRQFLTEVPTLLGIILFTWVLFIWMKSAERRPWVAFIAGGILGAVSLLRLNPFLLIPAVPVFLFFARSRGLAYWARQSALFLLGCAILIAPWMLTGTNAAGQPYFLIKFLDIINVRYGANGALQPLSSPPAVAPNLPVRGTLAAGFSIPDLDIQKFPGFVLNHTLHNFVGSVLTLPDSWQSPDQNLARLIQRPYWRIGMEILAPAQIPFILINLALLAFGLAWSWKRWHWAGLAPLFVFAVYALALGLGRTSGSRYLVPLDWVVDFYFGVGLLCLFQGLPSGLLRLISAEAVVEYPHPVQPVQAARRWLRLGLPLLLVVLALLIPAVQLLVPLQNDFCAPTSQVDSATYLSAIGQPSDLHSLFLRGLVLYPELDHGSLKFSLFTCKNVLIFEAPGFKDTLPAGSQVILGLVPQGTSTRLLLIGQPAVGDALPKILWQLPPE